MALFSKIESWAESTNDIEELRNAFIEVISNNNVDLEGLYRDHKTSIDRDFQRDKHLN